MKQSIEKYYDGIASNIDYNLHRWKGDKLSTKIQRVHNKKALGDALDRIRAKNTLEVGCGAGEWTKMIASKSGTLTANDISIEMIKQAKANCDRKDVKFIHGDFLESFALKENIYDCIICMRALRFIKDKKRLLNTTHRLLQKDGTFFAVTQNPNWLPKKLPYLRHKMFGKEIHATGRQEVEAEEIKHILIVAGFKNIKVYPASIYLPRSPKILNPIYNLIHHNTMKITTLCESYAIEARK